MKFLIFIEDTVFTGSVSPGYLVRGSIQLFESQIWKTANDFQSTKRAENLGGYIKQICKILGKMGPDTDKPHAIFLHVWENFKY